MRTLLLTLIVFVLFTACGSGADTHGPSQQVDSATPDSTSKLQELVTTEEPGWQSFLDSAGLEGSILVFDEAAETFHVLNQERAQRGFLPASTFKIPNTLIALESGTAADENHLIPYGGEDRAFEVWEQEMTLGQAYRRSCLPCYQQLTRQLGFADMQHHVEELGYPGMVFDSSNYDRFWVEGQSRISQYQQVEFLQRLRHRELPLQARTFDIGSRIMTAEATEDYQLYAKTGWAVRDGNNVGWYVGYVIRGDRTWYFATNVEPHPELDMADFPGNRILVSRQALHDLGVLPLAN